MSTQNKPFDHPAFPVAPHDGNRSLGIPPMKGNSGMSMRKFFAAHVLPAIIQISSEDTPMEDNVAEAYAYADIALSY